MRRVDILHGSEIKAGDTRPKLRAKLFEDGDPVNLSNATVDIKLRRSDASDPVINQRATIVKDDRGIVEYDWVNKAIEEDGVYELEFLVETMSGTSVYPSTDIEFVQVQKRI